MSSFHEFEKYRGVYGSLDLSIEETTVRWSNFDPRDPKMGVFLQSTEVKPPADIFLNESLPLKTPLRTPC
jgi:hypothetical protein